MRFPTMGYVRPGNAQTSLHSLIRAFACRLNILYMSVKLLTEHHLEFLRLKEAAQARLRLHLPECHIVGNHMSRLQYE